MKPFAFTLPPHAAGMRIGLYGGSFNPAHAGHRHVALTALKRLQLDAVWWLVTPGNPLKDTRTLPSLEERLAQTRTLANHPRFHATGIEALWGTRYAVDTVREMQGRTRGVNFVWVMGADNLATFHRWRHWKTLAHLLPIAIIDRPKATLLPLSSKFCQTFRQNRLPEHASRNLSLQPAPVWMFISAPRSSLSSTQIRHNNCIRT